MSKVEKLHKGRQNQKILHRGYAKLEKLTFNTNSVKVRQITTRLFKITSNMERNSKLKKITLT